MLSTSIAIKLGEKRETILTVKIAVNWDGKSLEIGSGDGYSDTSQ